LFIVSRSLSPDKSLPNSALRQDTVRRCVTTG